MLVSVGFLILMILAGGVVAWIADKLGRTLGKKRLTLFGMRPRHTATTMTVAAGMLIPLITFGLVTALSEPVRKWFLEGPRALEQRDELAGQVSGLEKQKEKTATEIVGLKKQGDDSRRDLLEKQRQLRVASDKLNRVQVQVAQLTSQISAFRVQISKMQGSLNTKQLALAAADSNLKSAKASLAALTGKLDGLTKNYETLQTSYQTLKTSYAEIDKQRQQANDEYVKVSTENDNLTKINQDLKDQNDRSTAKLQKTQSDLELAQLNLDDFKVRLVKMRALVDTNVSRPFLTPLIFGIGDELARITIPANTDENTARGLFTNLIKQAVQVAKDAGAKPTGSNDAAVLFATDDQGNEVPVSVQEDTIIKGVSNQDQDLVLVALCELNSYQGSSVPMNIQTYHDPLVYKRNDRVSEVMINGNQAEEQIIQNISDFLTKTVKPKALKDGMIPVAGQEESFGELSITDLVQLAHSIKDTARPVRLTALADADTRRGDSLRLHFRVR